MGSFFSILLSQNHSPDNSSSVEFMNVIIVSCRPITRHSGNVCFVSVLNIYIYNIPISSWAHYDFLFLSSFRCSMNRSSKRLCFLFVTFLVAGHGLVKNVEVEFLRLILKVYFDGLSMATRQEEVLTIDPSKEMAPTDNHEKRYL